MTKSGDDMIRELASLLGPETTVKTAETKEEVVQEDGEQKKEAETMREVLNSLTKLASELDEMGANKAANMVDDALKSIVAYFDEMPLEPDYKEVADRTQKEEDEKEFDTFEGEEDGVSNEELLWENLVNKIGEDKLDQFEKWLEQRKF